MSTSHGTRWAYESGGCRCTSCRAANAAHVAKVRARRLERLQALPEADDGHGTVGGYDSGCRCESCKLTRASRYWREGGPIRHLWRELVTETYWDARHAWEALRESGRPVPGAVAGTAGAVVAYYQLSEREFRELHPPPTLGQVMKELSS